MTTQGHRYDPSRVATDQLLRSYKFHSHDLTETEAEECRRMWLLQEIGRELQSRGVENLGN